MWAWSRVRAVARAPRVPCVPRGVRGAAQGAGLSYSDTLLLPRTTLPMRANAATNEAAVRSTITDELYAWQAARADAPAGAYVLHDGPPYANGTLHMGHFVNKTLKDVIVRYRILRGHRVHYVPGWDCHGLPIELKALAGVPPEQQRHMSPTDVRQRARALANEQIAAQMASFRSWSIAGDFDHAYRTMDPSYEAQQLRVFAQLVRNGLIQRGLRPVHWSPWTSTALADAELEYNDEHVSRSAWLRFRVVDSLLPGAVRSLLQRGGESGATPVYMAVWTTTPWTIPANQAVCYAPGAEYALLAERERGFALLCAVDCVEAVCARAGTAGMRLEQAGTVSASVLAGMRYEHPISGERLPVLAGRHVATDAGTGLVHTAPAHGHDDFDVCAQHGIEPRLLVDDEGRFTEGVCDARLRGVRAVTEGNDMCVELLRESGALLHVEALTHSYPYDWRSKKPVMIRATEQWFASVTHVRERAVRAVEDGVRMVPAAQVNRLLSMVKQRGDWCISRQRHWGVPIPAFFDTETGAALMTPEIVEHVADVFASHGGSDAWWTLPTEALLPESVRAMAPRLRRGTDTLDVWFDSGTSWSSALAERGVTDPADCIVEGSDQHRGWFQSLLWTAIGSSGQCPYRTVVTHGFVLDGERRKMAKSLGNIVDPNDVIRGKAEPMPATGTAGAGVAKGKDKTKRASAASGAAAGAAGVGVDVLRLWVASSDVSVDIAYSSDILEANAELYRKFRNTARFMTGNLFDFALDAAVDVEQLPSLERYVLAQLHAYAQSVTAAFDEFAFAKACALASRLATSTLSSLYFDVCKDTLYADAANSLQRRSVQTVLAHALDIFVRSIAPCVPHLAQEIWSHNPVPFAGSASLFQTGWLSAPGEWSPATCASAQRHVSSVERVLALRAAVLREVESIRHRDSSGVRVLGEVVAAVTQPRDAELSVDTSALQRVLQCRVVGDDAMRWVHANALAECNVDVAAGDGGSGQSGAVARVLLARTNLHKCPRCWRFESASENSLCHRCTSVVAAAL